ncbi:MAG: response regulator [Myxococcaceae bacterium]|nr:response regulator [Myxococcaceae bacterium]
MTTSTATPGSPTAARVPGRILVIDDDKSARLLLDRVLTRAGHQVVIVDTGEQGLEALARQSYDLIITDKNLPGIDGLELLRQARATNPKLQAIIITGFPTPETKSSAKEIGVFSYVTKPFGILDILGTCDGAIRAAREGQ